jgi:cell division septation protein DedD
MANKEFREIQVSSTLLVVIFLGVLALGVFIFLLGVSVGKNQARLSAPTQVVTQQIPEPVRETPVQPTPAEKEAGAPAAPAGGAVAPKTTSKDAAAKPPAGANTAAAKKTAAASGPLYYVQVAAFNDRSLAEALADSFRKQGYTAVVSQRPTSTRTWYRVRLGGYATRDQAVDLLGKLNAAAGKRTDYQVVRD